MLPASQAPKGDVYREVTGLPLQQEGSSSEHDQSRVLPFNTIFVEFLNNDVWIKDQLRLVFQKRQKLELEVHNKLMNTDTSGCSERLTRSPGQKMADRPL